MAKLYFYYSAMNAGKSTLLLQSAYNYRERQLDTLILVPKIGIKTNIQSAVSSRIGLSSPATIISPETNLQQFIQTEKNKNSKLSCILIDEAQFLTKDQVYDLCSIVDVLDLPILCYGIRSDFQAQPFIGSIYLLTLADHLIEVKTICHCGRKATMNLRIDTLGNAIKQGKQVLIGGNDHYIPTCRKHFNLNDSGKYNTNKTDLVYNDSTVSAE